MNESGTRRRAGTHAERRAGRGGGGAWFVHRPDRVVLWAFALAVFAAVIAAASSAQAASGGVGSWEATEASSSGGASNGTWTRSVATWYGPGFFGSRTACGQRLKRRTVGVAHKRLRCGTRVTFAYRGRLLRTRVIDRGPYANSARWDLTQAAARSLGLKETDTVRASVVRR